MTRWYANLHKNLYRSIVTPLIFRVAWSSLFQLCKMMRSLSTDLSVCSGGFFSYLKCPRESLDYWRSLWCFVIMTRNLTITNSNHDGAYQNFPQKNLVKLPQLLKPHRSPQSFGPRMSQFVRVSIFSRLKNHPR